VVEGALGPKVVSIGVQRVSGKNRRFLQMNDVWTWTTGNGWKKVNCNSPVPAPRGWHGAAVHGNRVFVFGGNRCAACAVL
jgi:hypothetical protein